MDILAVASVTLRCDEITPTDLTTTSCDNAAFASGRQIAKSTCTLGVPKAPVLEYANGVTETPPTAAAFMVYPVGSAA